ncbi:hypothetical protein PAXRUDRAFT_160876 [Paxillus rubicundulus Ve08.2h10]|uniref:Uncharacterized protein n=1 Tax=Paxillus rubicundulus Ve08.2h10 TaxID=930991 RepID=A0A0D0DF45_9AGAM|nr:hypothetical protein PAXRUDRAFT_160876 [Paxillus rubicundulus Ve08.2h10]
MDISELLNPTVEAHHTFDATDKDIYEAVMEAKRLQEDSDGNKLDSAVDGPPPPARNEALQVALLLQRFTKDLDDPFARKLEVMLGSFRRRTHTKEMQAMKPTKLTSYFSPKDS